MEHIYRQEISVKKRQCGENGALRLSGILELAQEISGEHCKQLGFGRESMAQKGLFWAVARHKLYIQRLPVQEETVFLETWPMPATRSAWPRAVRALDARGNVLFEVMSLWVIMDIRSRRMVLKSGIELPGTLRGDEKPLPDSLMPQTHENKKLWLLTPEDIDCNGHVNNARYLEPVQTEGIEPKEVTVCYLAEAFLGQELTLNWTMSQSNVLTVDGCRRSTDVRGSQQYIFRVRMVC